MLKKLPSEYVLVMAGKGVLFDNVEKKIEREQLQERCFLLGSLPQNEVPSLYKESDLFLLATNYEIYGMVILESMYFGTPVLTTISAGSQMLINDGIDGFVQNEMDSVLWAKKIQSAFANKEVENAGVKAKEKIEHHFLWNKTVDSFIEMYRSLGK